MTDLLTVDEVADRLRLGRRTVERMIATGEMRSSLIRRRRLVEAREVERQQRLAAARGRVA